jgi:ABC-2 type transport system permease protein
MWALTSLHVLVLWFFSHGIASLDAGPIACGYIGVILIGQFLIAVGLLSSSVTKNQVVAALMSVAVIFVFLFTLYWLSSFFQGGQLGKVFRFVSAFENMEDFSRGILDVRPLVLYLSGTVLALFVTTRIVESRKWR